MVGKREMQQLYDAMNQCIKKPIPAAERDRLNKLYKIGPYREWEIDENAVKRIAEIEHEVRDRYTYLLGRRITKTAGNGMGSGKKQLEAERERLIYEIENG